MGFLDLAKRRFSARNYCDKPVEREKLDKILEAGRVAPTQGNNQPQRILVVSSAEGLRKLESGINPYRAPLALIVCADLTESFVSRFDGKDSARVDASIVAAHMMMEATDLDLGSLWIGEFDTKRLQEDFRLPETIDPVCILLIGYIGCPPGSPGRHITKRKPLRETVFFESF